MRTVLGRSAGRVTLILVSAGMVGSVACLVEPAVAGASSSGHAKAHPAHAGDQQDRSQVEIGTAVKYVRDADGTVHQVR
jgi:hypothetical protein